MEDRDDASEVPEEDDAQDAPQIIAAALGVDGEHGPLFTDIDLELTPGFHAIQMPGGWGQTALLLTLAGRLKPTRGTVTVCGETDPKAIRRHCAIAAFADIDELEDSVTVQTVLAEQRRWLAPWYRRVPIEAGESALREVFGELTPPAPETYISELSDLDLFLLKVTLALFSQRPILVVGDLEQVRDNSRRAIAIERLGAVAAERSVVVGVTNPLGDEAPDHGLHDHRILTGKNS
ncbi:hypothetical protein BVU76_26855 [Mycolicibacterium porcinum]|nr:hypothetical protein BVU76_26855 [Mycolicibacterium porcinum]